MPDYPLPNAHPAAPIPAPAIAYRSPYLVRDPAFDGLHDPHLAEQARLVQLDRESALRDPLMFVPLTDHEHAVLDSFAKTLSVPELAVVIRCLWAARQAPPMPDALVASGRGEEMHPLFSDTPPRRSTKPGSYLDGCAR